MEKERLDTLLVKRGFFQSREKARSSIMAGIVYVNNNKEDKPGTKFNEDVEIEVKQNINPYVSRGGLKLEKAIKEFGIELTDRIALDVGASTGGFTDCMLKNSAKKVVAIDVGYGQLAWELRTDPRVINMERRNIRYMKPEDVGFLADFASIDVSFISLEKVLPAVKEMLTENGEILCLVKPQFEAGREKVGKHGVVREKETHREVLYKIIHYVTENGMYVKGLSYSPIKGPEGNIEYLLYVSKVQGEADIEALQVLLNRIVEESHQELE